MCKKSVFIVLLSAMVLLSTITAFGVENGYFAAAKGAVLIDGFSGRILASKDCHKRLPNASTTKIMTAILTLEQPNLDQEFVVDSDAIKVEGSSMGLQEGDIVTLRTLVWGMLLASGNDGANAAAVRIDGSIEAFCERMNQKAAELGMVDTKFSSPSGLELGEHYTSAYDLAILTQYAMKNQDFCTMAKSKSVKLYYGNPPYHRWLTNHNRLLWQCEDCVGVKTGYTKEAGRCLVTAAEQDGLLLIAVTLGCPDDFNTHHAIYDESFQQLKFVDYSDKISNLSIKVAGGEKERVLIKPLTTAGLFLMESEAKSVKISFSLQPFLYAPVTKNQMVGEACLYIEDSLLARIPLVTVEESAIKLTQTQSYLQQLKELLKLG